MSKTEKQWSIKNILKEQKRSDHSRVKTDKEFFLNLVGSQKGLVPGESQLLYTNYKIRNTDDKEAEELLNTYLYLSVPMLGCGTGILLAVTMTDMKNLLKLNT